MTRNLFRVIAILVGGVLLGFSYWKVNTILKDQPVSAKPPQYLALPLETVAQRAEVYIAGGPLQKALAEGRVSLIQKDGSALQLAPNQATIALNNDDQVLKMQVPNLLAYAAGIGVGTMLLLFGLIAPVFKGYVYEADSTVLTELHLHPQH